MPDKYWKTLAAIGFILFIASIISVFGTSKANAGNRCKPRVQINCPVNQAPGVKYHGNKVVKTIRVTICHNRWHDLRGGPGQRWWGLTYRYTGGGQENIKEIRSECTTRNVVSGTRAGNAHDCPPPGERRSRGLKWYWTQPMTVSGETYWVG
ncbi:hypothetical protein A2837_01590 [Candidatus Kaiserbacteria bacterium RIFCSPHIGHO2_01_FULL_46_22]|uniref:Uncharacterized protein n=1 Tax=Candidatus Kaiserbacteria bacterium RIFCSPHIGHO2_01_FULL_46_22 TaxID=1798475 RepID=A0A1F6BY56_9BACT|nr:MAG: hypothetical protein A2837_01590 [Candidatus Kaiserbacteria bacterium RIFCSPHIGHO2_01_FULL_46_22]